MEAAIKRYAQWVQGLAIRFASRLRADAHPAGALRAGASSTRPLLERRRMDLQLNGWRGSNKVLELRGLSKVVWTGSCLLCRAWTRSSGTASGSG